MNIISKLLGKQEYDSVKLWRKYEKWLKKNSIESYKLLNKPATKMNFQMIFAKLDISLPKDIKAVYEIHNGENSHDGNSGLRTFLKMELLTTTRIIDEYRKISGTTNKNWIPFITDNKDLYIGVDEDDELNKGQIILYKKESTEKVALANSFSELMQNVIEITKDMDKETYEVRDSFYFIEKLKNM